MATSSQVQLVINGVDNASKVMKGIGRNVASLGDKMKRAGAVSVAGLGAVSAGIFKLAKDAGQFNSVKDSLDSLSKGFNTSTESILDSTRKATAGTVSDFEIMNKSVKAMSLIGKESFDSLGGTFDENFARMATIAKKAARATGQDVEYMFDSIVTGVGRASPMILDNLGIVLDSEKAYEDYAKELGKTSKELTNTEKKTAILNQVLERGESQYMDVSVSAGGLTGTMQRLGASFKNTAVKIGQAFEPAVNRMVSKALPLLEGLGKWFDENSDTIKKFVDESAVWLEEFGKSIIDDLGGVEVIKEKFDKFVLILKNVVLPALGDLLYLIKDLGVFLVKHAKLIATLWVSYKLFNGLKSINTLIGAFATKQGLANAKAKIFSSLKMGVVFGALELAVYAVTDAYGKYMEEQAKVKESFEGLKTSGQQLRDELNSKNELQMQEILQMEQQIEKNNQLAESGQITNEKRLEENQIIKDTIEEMKVELTQRDELIRKSKETEQQLGAEINKYDGFKGIFVSLWEDIVEIWRKGWDDGIVVIWTKGTEWLKEAHIKLALKILQKWEEIKSGASEIWTNIKQAIVDKVEDTKTKLNSLWMDIKDSITQRWEAIKAAASSTWTNIKTTITNIIDNLKSGISDKIDGIKTFLSNAWDTIKSTAESAWNGLVDKITGIFDGVLGPIGGVIETITGWINGIISKISDAKEGASSIDANAFGGPVTAGQPTIVGERGPEVFVPSQSGSIKTMNQVGGMGGVTINIQSLSVRNDQDVQNMALELEKVLSRNNLISKNGIAVG